MANLQLLRIGMVLGTYFDVFWILRSSAYKGLR